MQEPNVSPLRVIFSLAICFALSMNAAHAAEGPVSDNAVKTGKKPNVLFIFSDDQRADTIGAWGNAHVKTPNLDRMASEGTSFTRTYCMGGMVGAICMPSRAMLLTGRTLFRIDGRLE